MSKQLEPGTISGSIVSLVSATIGASTITIPYLFALNGIIGGLFWLTFGIVITYFAGRILVHCGEITRKQGYDKLAKLSFGKRWKMIVGIAQLV